MTPENPKEVVRRGYDAISRTYRSDNAADGNYRRWITQLRRHLPHSGAVLDLGCGCGIPVCRILDHAGHAVTGVDISDVQIERARQLVPRATFIRADATEVTFPEASFDAVVCLFTLIHIPISEQRPLLERIAGWMCPGGALLITTGHTSWTGVEANWHGAPMWWSHADAATYRSWLAEARLQITDEDFFPEATEATRARRDRGRRRGCPSVRGARAARIAALPPSRRASSHCAHLSTVTSTR